MPTSCPRSSQNDDPLVFPGDRGGGAGNRTSELGGLREPSDNGQNARNPGFLRYRRALDHGPRRTEDDPRYRRACNGHVTMNASCMCGCLYSELCSPFRALGLDDRLSYLGPPERREPPGSTVARQNDGLAGPTDSPVRPTLIEAMGCARSRAPAAARGPPALSPNIAVREGLDIVTPWPPEPVRSPCPIISRTSPRESGPSSRRRARR